MSDHLLDGHNLVYLVLAGDTIVYSDLVPARSPLNFQDSLEVPPYTRQVEVTVMLFGVGGEPISVIRKILHPSTVRTALNTYSWKMLEDYLSRIIPSGQGRQA